MLRCASPKCSLVDKGVHIDVAALNALRAAKRILERSSLVVALNSAIGTRIDEALRVLPTALRVRVESLTQQALAAALDVAILSLQRAPDTARGRRWHIGMAAASGALGGAFGLAALTLELPLSTAVLLRAIADVAERHGEDLDDPESRLSCLEVFALGGRTSKDDAVDTAYFAVRTSLAGALREAARYLATHQVPDHTAPVIVKLLAKLSARFSGPVANKLAAQSVPVLGAVGGAVINTAFAHHFTSLAQAHFTVRALERRYGAERVRTAYDLIRV